MQIVKRVFQLCMENFTNGNDTINYTFRNLTCLDGEEERTRDTFQRLTREEWQQFWQPMLVYDELNRLEFEIAQENWETAAELLKPHITNSRLYELDSELWINLLFMFLEGTQPNWEYFKKHYPENVSEKERRSE